MSKTELRTSNKTNNSITNNSNLNTMSLAKKALEQGEGILRLTPTWVPRSFCVPGRRIKLHPDDYYVLGGQRGGIDER